ncbi:MAG: hypothetical protein ACI906_002647 [Candidatus Latescibacterota bacterium]|jgi:hypothetical protein
MFITRLLFLSFVAFANVLWAAEPYSCGPFLLQPGPTQMTIVIDHEEPVAATLSYRLEGGKEKKIRHTEAQRHHIFTLEGLQPDVEYSYQIKSSGGLKSAQHRFRTLPVAPEQYRLVALGDVRSLPHVWEKVSQRVFSEEKDALFIIGTGDYPADGSKYHEWIEQFFKPARSLLGHMPIWPAIGNHERTRGSGDPRELESHFFSLFELPGNERWYRVDYGYTTVLIIDSNSSMEPGEEQYEWLRQELRSPRKRFTLVAFHHAPFTSGPHALLDSDGTPHEWPIDQGRRFLVPLFEMYGVDLVLNGHDHLYERSQKDGIYYVVTGGGGAPLYKINSVENPYQQVAQSVNHYTTLDVESTAITLSAIDADGRIIDWFKVPLAAGAVERMRYAATQKLEEALYLGAVDIADKEADLTIKNVLDFPVQVHIADLAKNPDDQVPFALEPGASRQIELALAAHLPTEKKPAWRGGVYADLQVSFVGDDHGLPIEVDIERELVLAEPGYDVVAMETPKIDGILDEWGSLTPMRIDSESPHITNAEGYRGAEDFHAQVFLGWSSQGLHMAIEVLDDEVLDDVQRSIWMTDSIELFVDGRAEAERSVGYGPWVSQNIFPVERAAEGSFVGNGSWPVDAIEWKVSSSAQGYVLEASIPFALIKDGGVAQAGEQVRFDLIINDQDSGDKKESHHKLWSSASASSNTSGYGILKLK